MSEDDGYVAALRRERAHYQAVGDVDRAAEVTAELVRVGAEKPQPPVERAVRGPAEMRRRR